MECFYIEYNMMFYEIGMQRLPLRPRTSSFNFNPSKDTHRLAISGLSVENATWLGTLLSRKIDELKVLREEIHRAFGKYLTEHAEEWAQRDAEAAAGGNGAVVESTSCAQCMNESSELQGECMYKCVGRS